MRWWEYAVFALLLLRPARAKRRDATVLSADPFAFSASLYNVSMEENARGSVFAHSSDRTRIGVPLPEDDARVRFKIVEGDKQHLFKAHARTVGDFVFLRIRQQENNNAPLNRELREQYDLVVKATCKRKEGGNLEATATVRLTILDRNDASPMFTLDADAYEADVDDQLAPFSDVLRVEASDADIGLNGQIYYSLVNKSSDWMVDPVSGWIRSLRPLKGGVHELTVRAEDRTSRLFYFDDDQKQPTWTAPVIIRVKETRRRLPRILVEKAVVEGEEETSQLVATIRVDRAEEDRTHVTLKDDDLQHWFRLEQDGEQWMLRTVEGRKIQSATNVTVMAGVEGRGDANTTATIRIQPVHTVRLAGTQQKLEASVSEAAPVGEWVLQVDMDVADRDRDAVKFSLERVEKNDSLPFSIDEDGVVRVEKELDYEKTKEYKFFAIAKLPSPKQETRVSVVVRVVDANDHWPEWAAKWSRQEPIPIANNTKIGADVIKVTALDRDSGENGRVGYKLVCDDSQACPLRVDFETGQITVGSRLPPNESSWRVSVWAVDWGVPLPRASLLHLVVYRENTTVPAKPKPAVAAHPKNQAAPKWTNLPEKIEIWEDAVVGEVIYRVNASDVDLGYGGLVRYALRHKYFRVNASTGEVSVARALSSLLGEGKETRQTELALTALDSASPVKKTEGKLTVVIRDVNNNAPEFDQPWYRIRVSEDTKVGETVLLLSATDKDGGENGRVRFRLGGQGGEAIQVDDKGNVKLAAALDREREDVMRFTVMAVDGGQPQQITFANLTIDVEDVNDNAPQCTQQVTKVRIAEDFPDGGMVGCVAAWDADEAANARLRFSLEKEKGQHVPFRIDHHSGCVFVHSHEPLDFHKRAVYNLTIDVADNGETMLSSTCGMLIELVDIAHNSHSPEFDDVAHEASVYENMPVGTEVLTVQAKDPDVKEGDVVYRIVGGDGIGHFLIDNKGTIRTSAVLDREWRSRFWLTVEASDEAEAETRTAVTHVYVRVLDKNDHRPTARQPAYYAHVAENAAEATVVVKVEASDGDDLPGAEPQQLTYRIDKGDPQSFFRMDPHTGYVVTSGARRLDRETQARHELVVRVCDAGEPQLCTAVPLHITVTDVNDNPPLFQQALHHYNVPAGQTGVLCRVFAVDPDEGDNAALYYNITDGDPRFSIDEHGRIHASEAMKHDEIAPLTIQASDRGEPQQSASTRVLLTAVARQERKEGNRKPAIASKTTRIPISDADQVGMIVEKLEAADPDGDALWWRIAEGNVNETFAVRADTGALLLAKSLDHIPDGVSKLTLTVEVTDGADKDSTQVAIEMSRRPSKRPQFSAAHYRTQIGETTAIGTQVYTMKAEGASGLKPVVYSIYTAESTAAEDKLRIEPSTGAVVVADALDAEWARELKVVVAARQGALTDYATLAVAVSDDNDNQPRFLRQHYEGRVKEGAAAGTLVATVFAYDADSGENGVVRYSIASGNELGVFSVDSVSGEVRLARALPSDHVESILTVRASDGGEYPLHATATVRVLTRHEDDAGETVKMTRPVYQRIVAEDSPVGAPLLVVSSESTSRVRYSLHEPCPFLEVHPLSGAVSLKRWLTTSRSRTVECTVVASIHSGANATARVVIKSSDTNQHAPLFQQQIYRGRVREALPAGSSVLLDDHSPLIVQAVDGDSGPNALVGYRLASEDEQWFSVDLVSGAIRTRRPIDREKMSEWRFFVQASDMASRQRSSPVPALVIVSIDDVNDSPPVFDRKEYSAELTLPTVPGVQVVRVSATDADSVGSVRYWLTGSDHVDVDESGVVRVAEKSKWKEGVVIAEVHVSDGVHEATAPLTITSKQAGDDAFRFPQAEVKTSVLENTTVEEGTVLVALTAVGAPSGVPVTYSILNPHPAFFVHSGTGVVSQTGAVLDREEEREVRLVIQAVAHAHETSRAQCVLVVKVEDANDNAPRWMGLPLEATLSQEAAKGDRVISLKAVDSDAGANGQVHFVAKELPKQFKMGRDGKVTVAGQLAVGVYTVEVTAVDGGKPTLSSSETLRIDVVDKDQPVFTQTTYKATIAKEAGKNTRVTGVRAKAGAGGQIGYVLVGGDDEGLFSVDWESGAIKLRRAVPPTETAHLNLTVAAVDVTRKGVNATTVVVVEMEGVGGERPRFSQSVYRVRVRESAPVGTLLTRLSAADGNGSTHGITYAVHGANASVVSVDEKTGELVLASPLDWETQQVYQLRASAMSGSLSGEAAVVVEVDDVNDSPPRFSSPFSNAQLDDTARQGQFVAVMGVEDADSVASLPAPARLVYSLIEGDDTLFHLDRHTGVVSLARGLEEEDLLERKRHMNVSVSDGVFTAYGQLTVDIAVSGRRRPPPRFEQSQYVAAIKENNVLTNKSALVRVKAREGVAPLRFSLGGGEKTAWPVRIDSQTGRVHARVVLKGGDTDKFVIPLVVEDALGRRAFSTLTLSVLDQNDASPKFALKRYSASVSAASKEGDAVLTVSAADEDEDDVVEYTLLGDDRALAAFRLHPRQGTVTLAKQLNEYVGSVLSFVVRATDSANPPHHSTADVSVSVLAESVPVPRLSAHHYLFTVAEDKPVGTIVGKLQQLEGEIDEVRYTVVDGAADLPVSLDRDTGRLVVRRRMDRETRAEWRFAVRADAAGGAHAMATVTLRVMDVNDNAPLFHGNYERLTIGEDAPVGTSIAVFSATDKDRGPNARIVFSLKEDEGADDVRMDAESGWLLVAKKLDRERKGEYKLQALATDEGGLTTPLDFTLEIGDANDSPPMFDKKEYSMSVKEEDLLEGREVVRVRVSDADLPPHNTVRLFIVGGDDDGVFAVDGEGRVTVRRRRPGGDRQYALRLLASDGLHSAECTVNISVKAAVAQLECPEGDVRVTVSEGAAAGSVVYEELLTGADKYGLITEKDEPFKLDKEGRVVTGRKLDREKEAGYVVIRRAVDGRGVECAQLIRVRVEDVNDNQPQWERKAYEASINENLEASDDRRVFVVRVLAEDADAGENGRVRYRLEGEEGPFRVDETTGVVTVVRALDREQTAEYNLTVVAEDGGQPSKASRATVRVMVADQNDNPPVFERNEYSLQVMESEAVGYELVRLSAVGGDEGEKVTFSLDGNHSDHEFVKINTKTGVLTLAKALDHELASKLSIRVAAVDDGQPPLQSVAVVGVEVLDENDNAPLFGKASYRAEVAEDAPKGHKVAKVDASDKDSEHLGRVAFRLEGEQDVFAVDEHGWVTVRGELDREKTDSYSMWVEARDGGVPPKTSRVPLTVTVKDVNDNAPRFAECNASAVVQEGAAVGHVILTLSVKDADAAPFAGPFKVELTGESAKTFTVNEKLEVVTVSLLDATRKEQYRLGMVAVDRGGVRSEECALHVTVKEESRHPPKLRPTRVQLNTLMGEFRGGAIGQIVAVDEDAADTLRYQLIEGSVVATPLSGSNKQRPDPHLFRVEPETGEIWCDHSVPEGIHRMNVSVTDGKFSAVSWVQVEVRWLDQDQLDHAVAVRLREMTVKEFFAKHASSFKRIFAQHLNIKPDNVVLLSVQQTSSEGETGRFRRTYSRFSSEEGAGGSDVEVLFGAWRGGERGMLKPDHVYSRLRAELESISEQSAGVRLQLVTEVCTPGVCFRGECRERVWLDERDTVRVALEGGGGWSAPRHGRAHECVCPAGYGGARCDVEVNKCSRSPCDAHQMCVPADDHPHGFECACPPGLTGEDCSRSACAEGEVAKCMEEAELSVSGTAYFELSIAHSVETRLELEVEMRTVTQQGFVMYAHGATDYHAIELNNGRIEYKWDAGVGEGVVRSAQSIADGAWHTVRVSRRGRRVRLAVDGVEQTGSSPHGADVVNLGINSQRLVFGGRLSHAKGETMPRLTRGVRACFRRIAVDGRPLAKTRQGLRLQGASIGCAAEWAESACAHSPCLNSGVCRGEGSSFSCECDARFAGARCEVDTDPCASHACPLGVECLPLFNDYQCRCPANFVGKHCEQAGRAADGACASNPCGSGQCIPITQQPLLSGGFICNCSTGYSAKPCDDGEAFPLWSRFSVAEVVVCAALLLILICVCLVIVYICRWNKNKGGDSSGKYGEHCDVPHMRNPLVTPKVDTNPPPLPPRAFRNNLNGLPTVQVRPLPTHERVSSRGDSRSPSLGSGGWKKGRGGGGGGGARDYGSAADDLDAMGASCSERDNRNVLDALRRFGVPLDEPEQRGKGTVSSRTPQKTQRGRGEERRLLAGGDSLQCLSTADEGLSAWRDEDDGCDRIGQAIRAERLRLAGVGGGRIAVGDVVLSPVQNDADYMTMRPRRACDSAESQRRLLDDEETGGVDGPFCPPPPAHLKRAASPPLYDDPRDESTADQLSSHMPDIDGSDDELKSIATQEVL